jgi:hypothetical protein
MRNGKPEVDIGLMFTVVEKQGDVSAKKTATQKHQDRPLLINRRSGRATTI